MQRYNKSSNDSQCGMPSVHRRFMQQRRSIYIDDCICRHLNASCIHFISLSDKSIISFYPISPFDKWANCWSMSTHEPSNWNPKWILFNTELQNLQQTSLKSTLPSSNSSVHLQYKINLKTNQKNNKCVLRFNFTVLDTSCNRSGCITFTIESQ